MSAPPAPDGGRRVLFDFDGVLVTGDSFAGWLRREGLRPPLRRLAASLLAPVGLPLMAFPSTLSIGARMFLGVAVHGADPDALRRSLAAWGRGLVRRPGKLMHDGLAAVRGHLAAGDRVAVVSGSESTMVRAVLAEVGLGEVAVVASELDFDRPVVRVRRHCFGARKLHALAEVGIVPPWDLAYSDSPSDLPLLRGAREAVCVNWSPRNRVLADRALGDRARHVTWR